MLSGEITKADARSLTLVAGTRDARLEPLVRERGRVGERRWACIKKDGSGARACLDRVGSAAAVN
jgi:hypothetical protein